MYQTITTFIPFHLYRIGYGKKKRYYLIQIGCCIHLYDTRRHECAKIDCKAAFIMMKERKKRLNEERNKRTKYGLSFHFSYADSGHSSGQVKSLTIDGHHGMSSNYCFVLPFLCPLLSIVFYFYVHFLFPTKKVRFRVLLTTHSHTHTMDVQIFGGWYLVCDILHTAVSKIMKKYVLFLAVNVAKRHGCEGRQKFSNNKHYKGFLVDRCCMERD